MSVETAITTDADDYGAHDFCSREGAHKLKLKIEEFWAKRGYQVQVNLIPMGFHPAVRCGRFDVRSSMKNGLPSPEQIERAA